MGKNRGKNADTDLQKTAVWDFRRSSRESWLEQKEPLATLVLWSRTVGVQVSCTQLTVCSPQTWTFSSPIFGLARMTTRNSSQGLHEISSCKGKPWNTKKSHRHSSQTVMFLRNKPDLCLQMFPNYLLK